jgi:hypothetical protein
MLFRQYYLDCLSQASYLISSSFDEKWRSSVAWVTPAPGPADAATGR